MLGRVQQNYSDIFVFNLAYRYFPAYYDGMAGFVSRKWDTLSHWDCEIEN